MGFVGSIIISNGLTSLDILLQLKWQRTTKQLKTNTGEDIEKEKPLFTVVENANWCNHSGNQSKRSSHKINLLYDADISMFDICLKDTCSAMFTDDIFATGKKL